MVTMKFKRFISHLKNDMTTLFLIENIQAQNIKSTINFGALICPFFVELFQLDFFNVEVSHISFPVSLRASLVDSIMFSNLLYPVLILMINKRFRSIFLKNV